MRRTCKTRFPNWWVNMCAVVFDWWFADPCKVDGEDCWRLLARCPNHIHLSLPRKRTMRKELIATTYANSFAVLSGLKLGLDGIFPSFDKLVEVLNDPAAALSSVGQRIANLSSYAELDPAYFSEGVQALTAINLVLSFVKLLATYGRKLFALMDAAKSILKAYAGYEAASEGDDGTVQVNETMTDLEAVAILDLLNKREIKRKYDWIKGDLSFAKLLRRGGAQVRSLRPR